MDNINDKAKQEVMPEVQPNLEIPAMKPEVEPVAPETMPEAEQDIPQQSTTPAQPAAPVQPEPAQPTAMPMDPREEKEMAEVEDILEEDLGDIYNNLDPATKEDFKRQGEQTTKFIFTVLHKTRIKTHSILKAISKWLKIIPGLNRNFIEQESKIKTDKIIEAHEHEHDQK